MTTAGEHLENLFRWRRDVRHFDTRAIPAEDMDRLFAMAHLAPSVGNAQPWRFVRIITPALRSALADHVDGAARTAGTTYSGNRQALYNTLKLHGLREAPEVVAVFSEEAPSAGHGLGIATMPEALRYSTVLAAHNLWLTAQSLGLGVGWVSILDPVQIREYLAVPALWHFIGLLCIGYPEQPSTIPELERLGWQARGDWSEHVSAL